MFTKDAPVGRARWDAEALPRTLGSFLDHQAGAFGERQAVAAQDGSLTYAELAAAANRVAAALIAAGVSKGTRVGLLMPNSAQWLPTAFGIVKTGAWLVGLNTLSRAAELEYQLRHTDVGVLIAAARFLRHDYVAMLRSFADEAFRGARPVRCPQLVRIVVRGDDVPQGATAWQPFLDAGRGVGDSVREAVQQTVDAVDPAAVFFTSGSTATPKAAVLSHRALAHNAAQIAAHLGIEPDDRTWTTLPLFFSGGFCLCALSTLAAGGTVVLNEAFEAGAALARLESERCTVMVGWNHVPLLLEHPDFPRRKLVLRKGVGGNLPLADRLLGPGHRAVGNYGMTETATLCCSARHDDSAEIRKTFGRPLPGVELRVVDPEKGVDREAGEEGEIIVRSPAQMSYYYGTTPADCFDERGFFHTGDLGLIDERGCLRFTQRLKDVIKTMGVNVAAAEVERALETHPGVRAAYVVGVPHEVRGESVVAFVVARDASLDAEVLNEFLGARLASYKIPRHVFFLDERDVPTSASNKVEKGTLRARAVAAIGDVQ